MFHRSKAVRGAALLAAFVVAQGLAAPARADVATLDEFRVTVGTNSLFTDSFNRNLTLDGSTPTTLYSGVNFPNGAPANYFVNGTVTESTAGGGQAQLNTANGLVRSQPDPFLPVIQIVAATLQTGTGVLTPGSNFTTTAVFDLSQPASPLGSYGVFLTNRQTGQGIEGNTLELRVRECTPGEGACGGLSGPVLQFMWLDFVNNDARLIAMTALTPAQMANAQIELLLSHDASNGDAVTASFAFGNGDVFGSFTTLGSTGGGTDVFTSSLQFVRAGFESFAPPLPEPSALALALAGLAALGASGRRASRFRRSGA